MKNKETGKTKRGIKENNNKNSVRKKTQMRL